MGEVPHPLDTNYELLKAKLEHVKKTDNEYKLIEKYLNSTRPTYRNLQIIDVWRVDRAGEVMICLSILIIISIYPFNYFFIERTFCRT